jgi:hypothetical protein
LACEALDRADGLRKRINEDGEVIDFRTGPKVHPAVKEELACRTQVRSARRIQSCHVSRCHDPGP